MPKNFPRGASEEATNQHLGSCSCSLTCGRRLTKAPHYFRPEIIRIAPQNAKLFYGIVNFFCNDPQSIQEHNTLRKCRPSCIRNFDRDKEERVLPLLVALLLWSMARKDSVSLADSCNSSFALSPEIPLKFDTRNQFHVIVTEKLRLSTLSSSSLRSCENSLRNNRGNQIIFRFNYNSPGASSIRRGLSFISYQSEWVVGNSI